MINTGFLFASLVWGSIGCGYFIYGKKQQAFSAMIGGVLMMAGSYFLSSVLSMCVVEVGLVGAVYLMSKRGY